MCAILYSYKAIMINNDDDDGDNDGDDDDVSYCERFCILVHPPQVRSITPVNSRCSSFNTIVSILIHKDYVEMIR